MVCEVAHTTFTGDPISGGDVVGEAQRGGRLQPVEADRERRHVQVRVQRVEGPELRADLGARRFDRVGCSLLRGQQVLQTGCPQIDSAHRTESGIGMTGTTKTGTAKKVELL